MLAPWPDWSPFVVVGPDERLPRMRGLHAPGGVGDRLRTAAFAEIQARDAFLEGARRIPDAPEPLRRAWRALARAEDKHLGWLLDRMRVLGVDPAERKVNPGLWRSLRDCEDAESFARYMAGAEEWGRRAGEQLGERMAEFDPVSAALFARIAREEVAHIRLVERWFGPEAGPAGLSDAELDALLREGGVPGAG